MKIQTLYQKTAIAMSMAVALGLSACGSSETATGGGNSGLLTGIFIDAPVKGLKFKTSSQEDFTNGQGEFTYKSGEQIAFSIDGVELGSAPASSQINVFDLPNALPKARLLQSLDRTDREDGLIDISGVKFPDALKTRLKEIIQVDGEINITDFNNELTEAHLLEIQTESNVVLASTTPVTQAAAAAHIDDFFNVDFSSEDISKQTFVGDDGGVFVLSFKADGTGNEFEGGGQPDKDSFSWSFDDVEKQLTVSYPVEVGETTGEVVTVDLLSKSGNAYTLKVEETEDEGTEIFMDTLYKALPLTKAALDGKILAFDTSNDPQCTARTARIEGTKSFVKMICGGNFYEETLSLKNATQLDNAIYLQRKDQNGNVLTSTKVHLYKGDINDGTYVFIDEPQNNAPAAVFNQRIYVTDKEVSDPGDSTSETTEATKALLASKTFYAYFVENGTPALAQLDINAAVDSWNYSILEGLPSGSGTEALEVVGDQLTITHTDETETVQVSANDPKYLTLGTNNSFGRFYYKQVDAQAYYDSQTTSDTAFKFTTDYLNSKTLYNIYEECTGGNYQNGVCTGTISWEKATVSFTDSAATLSGTFDGVFSSVTVSYTITSEGYITFFDTEENETIYIKPIEKTDSFIRIDWSGQRDGLSNDFIEYLFFDEAIGDAFLADKNGT